MTSSRTPSLLRAAALLLTLAVLATGCTSGEPTGTVTPATPTTSPTTSPTPTDVVVDDKPAPSEPAVRLTGDQRPAQEISGIVSWEVQPGKNVNAAVAKQVSKVADAFLTEHFLRADRWQGSYAVKSGEMDEVKALFTTKMHRLVEDSVDWWRSNEQKYGYKSADWPKKQRALLSDKGRSVGAMFVTRYLTTDGKGPIKQEVTRRVIYSSDQGWPMAYIEVTGRRANNTGGSESLTAKFTFRKDGNRWLISGTSWSLD